MVVIVSFLAGCIQTSPLSNDTHPVPTQTTSSSKNLKYIRFDSTDVSMSKDYVSGTTNLPENSTLLVYVINSTLYSAIISNNVKDIPTNGEFSGSVGQIFVNSKNGNNFWKWYFDMPSMKTGEYIVFVGEISKEKYNEIEQRKLRSGYNQTEWLNWIGYPYQFIENSSVKNSTRIKFTK